MRYLSVCSGIEAASVAWGPLGWRAVAFSEIEPFPCAVLTHHYPDVPNLGDMTTIAQRILNGEVEAPDVLAGGTPCQSFSIAGLRKSLADERGNLTLKFVELADAIDYVRTRDGRPPSIIFWENVPGVLSTADNAFGCFLGALAGEDCELKPPGKRWANAGAVYGPARAIAWRVLDAQYFGLAQRRRRVFVVASAREGFDPAAVLFEFEGVRRDTPPSREARQVAPTIPARSTGGGGFPGTDEALSGYLQPITRTHGQGGAEIGFDRGPTLTCNQEEPIVAYGIRTANTSSNGWGIQEEITHTLDGAMGIAVGAIAFDTTQITSAANRSNPQPLVPIAFQAGNLVRGAGGTPNADVFPTLKANHRRGDQHPCVAVAFAIQAGALRTNPASGPDGVGVQADHAYTLEARAEVQAVQHAMQVRRLTPREYERLQGFNGDQSEKTRSMGNVEGQSPTLRRDGPAHVAVAFPIQECHVSRANLKGTGTGLGGEGDPMFTLQSAQPHGVATAMQVRRLTPREYERLQGFPDGYTAIPWRGKPASECPDGPRYKALGNSWAVPVVRWIGERINAALRERLGEGEPR